MAVIESKSPSYAIVNPAPSATVSVTRAAGEGLLVGIMHAFSNNASQVSSVVWDAAGDNQALTLLKTQQVMTNYTYLSVYYLPNPTSAKTANLTVTFNGNDVWYASVETRFVSGHDTSVASPSSVKSTSAYGPGTPLNDSVASAVGHLVVDFGAFLAVAIYNAAASGQTSVQEREPTPGAAPILVSSIKSGEASSTTMGWVSTDVTAVNTAHVVASIPASASSGTTIDCTVGNATAAGVTASITQSGSTTINCTVGNATAAGITASIQQAGTTTINCTVGNAAASGVTAAVKTFIVTSKMHINAGVWHVNQAVVYSWFQGGRIGALGSETTGSGTINSAGRLVTPIERVPGTLLVAKLAASAALDDVYLETF